MSSFHRVTSRTALAGACKIIGRDQRPTRCQQSRGASPAPTRGGPQAQLRLAQRGRRGPAGRLAVRVRHVGQSGHRPATVAGGVPTRVHADRTPSGRGGSPGLAAVSGISPACSASTISWRLSATGCSMAAAPRLRSQIACSKVHGRLRALLRAARSDECLRPNLPALLLWILEAEGRKHLLYPFALPHLDFHRRCRQFPAQRDRRLPRPRSRSELRLLKQASEALADFERPDGPRPAPSAPLQPEAKSCSAFCTATARAWSAIPSPAMRLAARWRSSTGPTMSSNSPSRSPNKACAAGWAAPIWARRGRPAGPGRPSSEPEASGLRAGALRHAGPISLAWPTWIAKNGSDRPACSARTGMWNCVAGTGCGPTTAGRAYRP